MLYAVACEGLAPCALAKADPRSRTPWNGQLVLAVAAVAPIGLGIWQGSYLAAFGWTGQVIVFFILIPHLAVNLANPIYHLRYRHERFHWLTNAAVPALGLAIDGYVLYTAFFQNLPGKHVQVRRQHHLAEPRLGHSRHDMDSQGMDPATGRQRAAGPRLIRRRQTRHWAPPGPGRLAAGQVSATPRAATAPRAACPDRACP
jgi:amino acid transporter